MAPRGRRPLRQLFDYPVQQAQERRHLVMEQERHLVQEQQRHLVQEQQRHVVQLEQLRHLMQHHRYSLSHCYPIRLH